MSTGSATYMTRVTSQPVKFLKIRVGNSHAVGLGVDNNVYTIGK
jgi:hypothetical protein